MKVKEFALFALVAGLLISTFLKCTDSVVNPYHVAPSLELPTDTLKGYVGTAIDSLVVDVKNNVDVDAFGISLPKGTELPKGLVFDAGNGILYGVPEETANFECAIYANNEWGRSKEDVPFVLQIAPSRPGKPVPTSTQSSVTLAWNSVEGAAEYIVYRREESEEVFSLLTVTDATSVTDESLIGGSVISYYLVAQTADSLVSKASDTVEVEVGAETVQHSPTVQITGPADGAAFDLGSEVTVAVEAADEDHNLRLVYFFVDGNEHATVTSAPYSAVWTASSGGEHTIKVVAEDAGGLTAEDLITIRVNSDKGIAFTSPSSDTVVGLSETINFAAQTSSEGEEPEQILLSLGDSVLAECESSLCAFEWTAVEGGRHEFTATAHYADGDSVFHKVTVRVNRTPQLTGVVDTTIAENQSLVLQIIGSDPDDDILTLEAANLPNNAVFQPAGDSGTFSWKPGYEQAGEYSVIITVSDGVESVGKSMTITVTEENRPPLFALVGDTTISEKQNFTIGVSASDDDGDEVVLTGTTLPEGATFTDNGDGSGTLSWTPNYGDNGEHQVAITAEDGTSSTLLEFTIAVGEVNRAPKFVDLENQSVGEGQQLSFAVTAQDPNGDNMTLKVKSGTSPSGAEFTDNDDGTGLFTWTPGFGTTGNHDVTFVVSDGTESTEKGITISVGDVNRPPELSAVGDTVISENDNLKIDVSASDKDGDGIKLTIENEPSGATFTDNGDGTGIFSWKPGYSDAGEYENIKFIATDDAAESESDVESMTITVNNKDRAPRLENIGDKSVEEDKTLSFQISAEDRDGDPITYYASGLPSGATFDESTATFSWKPSFEQSGKYNVTFKASAGGLNDQESVAITVTNKGRAPKFNSVDDQTTQEQKRLKFSVSATDPDKDPISYSASELPNGATFDESQAEFSWKPDYSQAGTYTVTFVASDGSLEDEMDVKITVTNVDQPPSFNAVGDKTVSEDQNLSFTVEATDPDGDPVTYSASGLPSGASFNETQAKFTWKPNHSQAGTYDVKFTATAGGLSDELTVTIIVGNEDQAPELDPIGNKTVKENKALNFTVSGSDPDGDDISYSATGVPSGASFNNASGAFSWKPGYDDANTYSVTFTVTAGGLKDQETITITVENVDRPPYFEQVDDITVKENEVVSFGLEAHDPDVPFPLSSGGGGYSVSHGSFPSGAVLNMPTQYTTGYSFAWTPNYNQAGNYVVSFTVESEGKTATMDVSITVENVNRAPTLSGNPPTSVGKGNTYTFTVDVDDPDGDNVSLKLLEKPSGMQVSGKTITWSVDWLSSFRVGDQDYTVKVEGKDSHGAADTMIWTVDINEHLWQSKAVNLPADYEILAVLNEDTLYARGSNGWEVHAKFKNAPWTKICDFGNSEDYPMISELVVVDRKLFAGGLIDGYDAGVVSFSLSGAAGQTLLSGERLGWYKDFFMNVSPQGDFAAARYRDGGSTYNSAYGVNGDTTIAWGMYENGASYPTAVDVSGNRIIVVGRGLTFYSTDGGSSWSTSAQYRLNVALDCNDGDTAYVLDSSSTMNLHRVVFDGNSLSDNYVYSMHEKVQQVKMISGSTGWVVISDELYFTENGFSTKHKENLGIAGLNVDKLFINKNTKRPFVYAGGKIYY